MTIKPGNIDKELPDQYPRILIRVSMSDLDPDANDKLKYSAPDPTTCSTTFFVFLLYSAQPTKLYLREAVQL
jgi:hypothetical protein